MAQIIDQTNPKWINIPNSESDMWKDTATLDAGTVMILISNFNHLKEESCKHLLSVSCAGYYPSQDHPDGYYGITDYTEPDLATAPDEYQISWNGRTGKRFGPFYIPVDGIGYTEPSDMPQAHIRNVILKLQIHNNAGTVDGYCYLTADEKPPTEGYLAKSIFTDTTNGTFEKTIPLIPLAFELRTRIEYDGEYSSFSIPVYVWVGMKFSASNSDLIAISAFESREEV